jgi:predicted RNase H-like HicB family nuclease
MNINVKNLSVQVKRDKETGLYVGIVPGLTGGHTQASTIAELKVNLTEVIEMCLEERVKLQS